MRIRAVLSGIVGLPADIWQSILAKGSEPSLLADLTDRVRARLIAWSDVVALGLSLVVVLILKDRFTPLVMYQLLSGGLLCVAFIIIGFCVGGASPTDDLEIAKVGTRVGAANERTGRAPLWIRVLALGNVGLFGWMIHVTGGPVVSPFSAYALGVVVLGVFLASTRETRRSVIVLGIGFYVILTLAAIPASKYVLYFRGGAYPTHLPGPRWAYCLVTAVTVVISGIVNREVTQATQRTQTVRSEGSHKESL